eukprot:31205-Chlamydomonas_euryale.AAC.2
MLAAGARGCTRPRALACAVHRALAPDVDGWAVAVAVWARGSDHANGAQQQVGGERPRLWSTTTGRGEGATTLTEHVNGWGCGGAAALMEHNSRWCGGGAATLPEHNNRWGGHHADEAQQQIGERKEHGQREGLWARR